MLGAAATLTVVLANVGNVNVAGCGDQAYKLCQRPVEQRAGLALSALKPDVAALIEVLPPALCERAPSSNPANLCSGDPPSPPSQAVRLLGFGTVATCDERYGWDCLATRAQGPAQITAALVTRAVQPGCEDDGFTLSTTSVRIGGWPVTTAVAHPDARDTDCRAAQLRDLLEVAIPPAGPALVLGDLNVDPYREDNASATAFKDSVPSRFAALSGDAFTSYPGAPSQLDPNGEVLDGDIELPVPGPLAPRTLDHVLARGLAGSCEVQRVDGGGGMDHRAQVCKVEVPEAIAPPVTVKRRRCRVSAIVGPGRDDLTGVRFRARKRVVVDSVAPYAFRRPKRAKRVTATPLTLAGEGPRVVRKLRRC